IDLAKPGLASMEINEKTFHLPIFISEILKLTYRDCEKKNLKLYTEIDNLPNEIISDPNRLRQVLINLLRNSVKYTSSGYIKFKAEVLASDTNTPNETKIRFQIEDTGKGIQADKLKNIFDAFFQIDQTKNLSEGGVGLGLSIVKELVNKMNGSIKVQSKPNVGSTFSVEFDFKSESQNFWLSNYRTYKEKVNLFLYTNDPYLIDSLKVLALHPSINFQSRPLSENIIEILNNNEAIISAGNKTYSLIDIRNKQKEFESISKVSKINLKRVRFIVDEINFNQGSLIYDNPILPFEVLPKIGFIIDSSKTYFDDSQANNSDKVKIESNLSIIIADDDDGNIELYRSYLSTTGWTIKYCQSGLDAWNSYQDNNPNLMVLDLRMPDLDGLEVIERVRGFEKTNNLTPIPIIVITADIVAKNDIEMSHQYEKVKILEKPIRKSNLLESIKELI
ncbi:MAG: response regulator, partial [Bdellovibrionales bacterium]|nr:response regulator [Bdellovibrionales bacterium]